MTNKAPSWHKPNRSPRKQVEARWMGEETAGSGIGRYIAIPLAIVAAAFLLFGMGSLALHVHQKPTVEAAREAEINAMRIANEPQRRINAKTHRVPKGTAPSRPAQPSIEDIDPCTSALEVWKAPMGIGWMLDLPQGGAALASSILPAKVLRAAEDWSINNRITLGEAYALAGGCY